jgi:hypothetical protein
VLVRRDAWALAASGLVFVISLDVMLFLLLQDELAPPEVMLQRPGGLAWIAAACVGGFALCPYLDLTFHRARGATTPAGARAAFSLGFGVLFLAMIVATLLYAHLLKLMIAGPVLAVLSVHLINQSGFTLAVHLRELTRRGAPLVAAGVVGCLAAVGAGLMSVDEARGEMFYLCFMGFYGLVFPAYVWLCVWPTRGRERPSSRALVVWLVATLLAVPTFWMGFVKTRPAWLGLGLGVVLLARLLVGPHRPARAEP